MKIAAVQNGIGAAGGGATRRLGSGGVVQEGEGLIRRHTSNMMAEDS